jgi:hypothetical protein
MFDRINELEKKIDRWNMRVLYPMI